MITTFIGANDFLIREKTTALVDKFKKDNDHLAVERVSVEEMDFEEFKQSLLSYSLFADSRLVILDQPSLSKSFTEEAKEILESVPETTEIIIIETSVDRRSSYYKLLQTTNLIVCDKLSGPSLINWIVEEAKSLGARLSGSDAKYLSDRVGDDQLLLSHELEKLAIYDKDITRESIDLLTVESSASTIFQLLDAAFNNLPDKALSIYDKQRLAKVPPEQILAMFTWQLQVLAVCLSAGERNIKEIISKTKMSPYSLDKAMHIAKRISFSKLASIIRNLMDIDYSSKTISYNLDQALKNFIVEASSSF